MNIRLKQRSAYWRGEKIVIFFKRSIIVLFIFIIVAVALLGAKLLVRAFPVKNILVSGNYHLEESEIKDTVNIRDGSSLVELSLDELKARLERNSWIKKVSLRKRFPDTIMVNVEEAVPKALLSIDKKIFLIDTGGNVLEEIEDESTSFLPVIVGINPKKDRGGILEAMKLINALDENDILSRKESIEIMLKPYGLVMNLDGEYIKVGYGRYAKKLGRWKALETEVKKKDITIAYVDLRFENEVIVKPLRKVKERR
ncbi:MAG: FtsQ-type POTRA domain-containing protein [Candidatus Mariimomonas ferrooxydans]